MPGVHRPQVSYIGIWFYQLSLLFSKLSILMLYLRVLTYSGARYIVMVVIAFVVGYNIWGMYALATQCTPAAAAWDIRVAAEPGVRCRGNDHLWTVVSLHISSDFIIFSIPLPIVWRLRMPLRRKVGLLGVFALGFL